MARQALPNKRLADPIQTSASQTTSLPAGAEYNGSVFKESGPVDYFATHKCLVVMDDSSVCICARSHTDMVRSAPSCVLFEHPIPAVCEARIQPRAVG